MRVKTDARFTQAGLRLCAALIVAICATTVLMIPTSVPPAELPSLVVSRGVDDAVLARYRRDASRAPSDTTARRLTDIVDEAGRRESRTMRHPITVEDEEEDVLRARARVISSHGIAAIAALRAQAVLRFVAHFRPARVERAENHAIVGGFRRALLGWGVIRSQRVVAAPLVVRTLYAARWNVICRLPPTSGMARQERRVYFGWFALHAETAHIERRVDAAIRYGDAGDDDDRLVATEAVATLLYRGRQFDSAATAFDHMSIARNSPRLRNFARAAHALAE